MQDAMRGIYTDHCRRSNPDAIGANLACLDAETPFLPQVIVNDGIHHPYDGPSGRAGLLHFVSEENP
ncbi:hypothetical protein JSE7799_01115 [Jannaschia seosinensis]|uniref:Uncharacterized protein n=1 Tax=Jannaschia seosinensis TaxID=313367 RepID=A0A0M7B6T3_9RHOB|nr:hypothetical protein [Jannaschia seosinensis]CUH35412.1 hypothetical protein JSE7799_01115 [Jannaschia seosinensis]